MALAAVTDMVFPKTPPDGRLFRSGAARFFGWLWMVFAAANLVDVAWRGRDVASFIAAATMVLGSGIAYVVALRPRILADAESVRLHNLVRDVRVPWAAVDRIEGGDAVYVHSGGREFRAFVLQTSPRTRAKTEAKARRAESGLPDTVAEFVRGRTATDFAVEQLREMAGKRPPADEAGDGTARPTASVTWAWPAIIALVAPTVLLAVAITLAMI
jgi:Bacterial PH domain